jgi:hypothetical protein
VLLESGPVTVAPDWPLNGSELVRWLGLPHDRYHVLSVVRPLLIELGCPKQSSAERANFVVDEAMAKRVAQILKRRGFPVGGASL